MISAERYFKTPRVTAALEDSFLDFSIRPPGPVHVSRFVGDLRVMSSSLRSFSTAGAENTFASVKDTVSVENAAGRQFYNGWAPSAFGVTVLRESQNGWVGFSEVARRKQGTREGLPSPESPNWPPLSRTSRTSQ